MTHEILNPDTSEKSLNHNFTSERSLTSCSAAIYMYVYRYHINKRLFHNECDMCQIQFISKDILDRHNIQYHHVNDLDKVNKQDKETSKSDNDVY